VLDMAELPTFQARQAIDADHDGEVSGAEAAAWRDRECPRLAAGLRATVDGRALPLRVTGSWLAFPDGAGGLETLRLECALAAAGRGRPRPGLRRRQPGRTGRLAGDHRRRRPRDPGGGRCASAERQRPAHRLPPGRARLPARPAHRHPPVPAGRPSRRRGCRRRAGGRAGSRGRIPGRRRARAAGPGRRGPYDGRPTVVITPDT
jgi:hypothetical protein